MASIVNYYNYVVYELQDPRVKDWPFMSNLAGILTFIGIYLYLVLKIGPRYMEHRKAYSLKRIIAVYNIFQVIANAILLRGIITSGWTTTYSWGCQTVIFDPKNEEAMRMATYIWWLFALKMLEMIETVFFILRKKNNQISFLHLYHHVTTLFLSWIGARYVPGGMASFQAIPNCFVHVIMYTYYLLSLGGPEMQKKLRKYKPWLTIMQMVQFCILVLHAFQVFLPYCNLPRFLAYIYIPNIFLMFYLFYDFYKKTYKPKPKVS